MIVNCVDDEVLLKMIRKREGYVGNAGRVPSVLHHFL